jgi:hypothetical protein
MLPNRRTAERLISDVLAGAGRYGAGNARLRAFLNLKTAQVVAPAHSADNICFAIADRAIDFLDRK